MNPVPYCGWHLLGGSGQYGGQQGCHSQGPQTLQAGGMGH